MARKKGKLTLPEQVLFFQEGGWVERYHTRPGIKADTNAHHSHQVAMFCYLLTVPPAMPRAELLMAALTHDLPEQVSSDVSAPSKRLLGIRDRFKKVEVGILNKFGFDFTHLLTPEEMRTLELADALDGLLYCAHEAALGNKLIRVVAEKYINYIIEFIPPPYVEVYEKDFVKLREIDAINAVLKIWKDSNGEKGPNWDCFDYDYETFESK